VGSRSSLPRSRQCRTPRMGAVEPTQAPPSTGHPQLDEALAALDLSRPVNEHPDQYAKLLDALQRALNESRS
jgi:hypothetical protein